MNHFPKATLVNMLTVTIGSLIGLCLQSYFSDSIINIVFQALGLGTLLIGIMMALRLPNGFLIIILTSLILGAIIGALLDIKSAIDHIANLVQVSVGNEEATFTQGLITAFLLFCIGAMTIIGALEEGIEGKRDLLYVKSLLDGFSSIILASSFGIGVLFSIFPMLLFQGGITILANYIRKYIDDVLIDCLSAIGGLLIIGIAFNLLKVTVIQLENLLPSLLFVLPLAHFYKRINNKIISAGTTPNLK